MVASIGAILDLIGSEPADTVAVDRNRMRATHNSFPFHDQAGAIAAARILMRMRNGQPDMTAKVCRYERDYGKVAQVVGHLATPRKQHFRFRCTVVVDDAKVEFRIEVTRKKKIKAYRIAFDLIAS